MGISDWWRRRQADRLDIAESLWEQVESELHFLCHLLPDERAQLRLLARQFIAEKQWSGAQGLQLTPRIQLTIALQACLLVLHLGLDWYAGWVGIVVYPGDFLIPRRMIDEDGVVHVYDDEVMGEAWHGGPVLLSWFDDLADAHGINVVIHEFAHKLDMRSGDADGVPPLHEGMSRRHWIAVMREAFDDFQRRVDRSEETLLDPYGAEWPSEFFAVASEAFFENPAVLLDEYPHVHEQLRLFYRQNPVVQRAVPR
ncbi:M90 family metallopeptidase [Sulfuritalea sp.]|uniref:M90 family metallopeptidase n=1 Tax=Sulfuritalea sp. TaxID=2480090 RepID=UPI001ACD497C|nr:M90 family metallopeptidase [Sulfuritalea sp.]MBN8474319.1 zinc-dependent peptidase [Sulfuritalea sp.]